MQIEHIAIWTNNLQQLIEFYVNLFNAHATPIYENKKRQFKSSFIAFDSGTRLELMTIANIQTGISSIPSIGLAHFCISVGSKTEVDNFTEQCRHSGIVIKSEARTTGDGYYESVILDPDGNHIEISV